MKSICAQTHESTRQQSLHLTKQLHGKQVLRVQSLFMRLGSNQHAKTILNDMSFNLRVGHVMAVLGPNGVGKSSLLHSLSGDIKLQNGQIFFDEQSITDLSPKTLATMRAVLPQQQSMSFNMRVSTVVAMGAYPFIQANPNDVTQWVAQALQEVDLEALQNRDYLALSGGEQQRVQFARLLVQAYAIIQQRGHVYIFLDEPTASLDPKHQVLLMRVVRALADSRCAAVLVVMHDLNLAARWCDKVLLLNQGEVVTCDHPKQALTSDRLESVYGIPMTVMRNPHHDQSVWVVSHG
jgi:iron complex transport system ATP-binding protein